MLISKLKEPKVIKYNGIEITVEAGGRLDVREFEVLHKNVSAVERHIQKKNPGDFEQTETVETGKLKSQYEEEIDSLKKEVASLKKLSESYIQAAGINANKAISDASQINELLKENASLKGKIENLEQKIKDINEENDATLAKISGGKKAK